MTDTVKKIFMILIVVVICIVIGAFTINILVPNALTSTVNAVEDTIFSATGMSIDLNGDAQAGESVNQDGTVRTDGQKENANNAYEHANEVEGFGVEGKN